MIDFDLGQLSDGFTRIAISCLLQIMYLARCLNTNLFLVSSIYGIVMSTIVLLINKKKCTLHKEVPAEEYFQGSKYSNFTLQE